MNIWIQFGGQLTSQTIADAVVLDAELSCANRTPMNGPRLLPAESPDGIAALLVPTGSDSISCNGVPLGPGAHIVQHTDRIDLNELTFWAASSSATTVTNYDPAVYGTDVFCFITKARLKPGDEIVCCPNCELIYRQAAWQMAIDANPGFRCPRCRFNPFEGDWEPTLPATSSLDRIMELARDNR